MRDLYRRLGVSVTARDDVIRAALNAADADTREAAAFILLEPRRRAVYDRNRQTVATIGRLRANLGLNLTRFWPRSRFGDFTIDLTPRRQLRPAVMGHNVVAWAFGLKSAPSGNSKRHSRRWRVAALAVAVLLTAVIAGYIWVR